MSSISIIGLGNMASALADRALAGGNAVEIIGRDPAKAKELAGALGGATVGTAGAAPAGDIVISLGLRPMDTGQLAMARTLEKTGLLMLGLVAHSVKHTNFFLDVSILS
ncbi:NAD(P)-binding domain-containing protein [Streptomyces sp. NBC_01795]|uniref:NAD(P)-binding domain-containing protein n=1 Tax=Streptomyces sp. NBC_01795 TaxID=2975943 RepID=UPI002DDA5529|nr:NAD(P)-binding domain-containing protein [Streptomyces sp. NBC_01795]WSA90145.1 NAD(P)-binding domain-containing protein [Streptomyces sp. NBC_01795]